MNLIDKIVSRPNLNMAYLQVKRNKGSAGIDGMTVDEVDVYIAKHKDEIITSILERRYKAQPVRRVYIPKDNGKTRPLGIPTVINRVIQQAIAQQLTPIYENIFSDFSFGFRPNRDCHKAIFKSLEYLNEGYEWVIDIDIEKFFDKVNQDKLISILREQVNDGATLSLIRAFLRAGVMEDGLISPSEEGVPQGGLCRYPHNPPYAELIFMPSSI